MLQAPLPYLYGCTQQVGRLQQPPDTGCGGCGHHCLQASTPQQEQPEAKWKWSGQQPKMLPHKLFMRRTCFSDVFFPHLKPLAVTLNTVIFLQIVNVTGSNCKLPEDAVRWHLDVHTEICADAADVRKPIPFWF